MKMKHIFFLLIFTTTIFSPKGNAQSIDNKELLNKSYEALKNIKTIVYKVDYATKYLARRDTVRTTAVCSLYVAPKDKMKTYNIVDSEYWESGFHVYGHRRYDGKKAIWANYPIDSLDSKRKPSIINKKRERNSVVENYSDLLLKEYFIFEKPLIRYLPVSDKILVTEEVHNDIPVYVITVAFQDQGDTRDNVEKHYIRKSDFLPIVFYSFLRFENMEQYNYYEVEYLAINPDIPLKEFKVSENETINAKERYQTFKEKTNNFKPK